MVCNVLTTSYLPYRFTYGTQASRIEVINLKSILRLEYLGIFWCFTIPSLILAEVSYVDLYLSWLQSFLTVKYYEI